MARTMMNPAALDTALAVALLKIAPIFLQLARDNAPYETGEFSAGLESRVVPGVAIEIYSTTDEPLMEWVLLGTSPHSIGEEGQFLYNPGEQFAAAGAVQHPGTAPDDFATPTLIAVNEEAQEILLTAIEDAFVL